MDETTQLGMHNENTGGGPLASPVNKAATNGGPSFWLAVILAVDLLALWLTGFLFRGRNS